MVQEWYKFYQNRTKGIGYNAKFADRMTELWNYGISDMLKTVYPSKTMFCRAYNKGMNKQQQPDSGIHDTSAHCPHVYQVSIF